MLPIKKLYIDSKAKSKDSRSTSDFAIDLVESLTMPDGAVFQVCDVLIPHTWYLIDEHNCNIYFNEVQPQFRSGNFSIALTMGNYDGDSLAGEISKQIQAATTKLFQYAVNYDGATGSIRITASGRTGNVGNLQRGVERFVSPPAEQMACRGKAANKGGPSAWSESYRLTRGDSNT